MKSSNSHVTSLDVYVPVKARLYLREGMNKTNKMNCLLVLLPVDLIRNPIIKPSNTSSLAKLCASRL